MFGGRLRALRRARGLTQAEVAGHFGLTQQAVAKWEAGRSFPEPPLLARLAEWFEVSAGYLLGLEEQAPAETVPVRVMGTVRAGYNALALEEDNGTEPASVRDAEAYRYLLVQGDSMEPYIHDGDLALVHLQPTLRDGDLGVVLYNDGEATLKRFRREGSRILLEPFNPAYPTVCLSGAELEGLYIFGKVVETKTRW